MLHEEFKAFKGTVGSLLSLSSGMKAVGLRKQLGAAIDLRLARFPKGIVQEKKRLFVQRAKLFAGVDWNADEPHKIITTLKNSGGGNERMALALFFLCYKTSEFGELRTALDDAVSKTTADPRNTEGWPPKVEFFLSDLVTGKSDPPPKQLGEREIDAIKRIGDEGLKTTFRYILDNQIERETDLSDTGAAMVEIIRATNTSANDYSLDDDINEQKLRGRRFVENDTVQFLLNESGEGVGSLAILDIDDLTKINKVYGFATGDMVIEIVGDIINDTLNSPDCIAGRCGDDTFFIVLRGANMEAAVKSMDLIRENIKRYAWGLEADGLRVSASIGIADYRTSESSIDMAIRAGLGMRNAKALGGNTITKGPSFLPQSNALSPTSTIRIWS